MPSIFSKPLRLTNAQILIVKILVHLVALGYLLAMFVLGFSDQLGADPVEALLHFTGKGGINLLLLSLMVSPLAKLLPCGDLMRFRRLLGLYVFFYAMCHLLTYALFELQLNLSLLASEIIKRPYITVGFAAFVILAVLALTSPMAVRKSLGRRWQTLHNGIYLCLILVLLHYTWSLKTIWGEQIFYWLAGIMLLLVRWNRFRRQLTQNKALKHRK